MEVTLRQVQLRPFKPDLRQCYNPTNLQLYFFFQNEIIWTSLIFHHIKHLCVFQREIKCHVCYSVKITVINKKGSTFWLRITDEVPVHKMRIWSILLIKSDLKWCIHLSRSLFFIFDFFPIIFSLRIPGYNFQSSEYFKIYRYTQQNKILLSKSQTTTYNIIKYIDISTTITFDVMTTLNSEPYSAISIKVTNSC